MLASLFNLSQLIASTVVNGIKPIKKSKSKRNLLLESMAKHHPSFVLLLLLLLLLRLIATVSATCPMANTTSMPLSTSLQPQDDLQLNNIIEAMIGSGDFNSWVNVISSGDFQGSSFSIWATFFIPSNDFHFPLDPFIVAYHVVPQRLSFSDLLLLKPLSRIPTLLPSKSILVTNTSASNFTLDNSLLFYPDLYLSSSIAVHGIQKSLDYSVYGDSSLSPQSLPPPSPVSVDLFVDGEVAGGGRMSSDAADCLYWQFPMIFLVVFGIFGIQDLWESF